MNRLRALRPNSALPNERTPLLPGSSRVPRDVPPTPTSTEGLPHIGSFVAEMKPEDLHKYSLDNLYPPALHSRPEQTAFSVSALLYYRSYLRGSSTRGRDIWVQWKQEEQNEAASKEVETLLERVWARFLAEEGSSEELQDVLWTAYPLYPDSRKTVRGECHRTCSLLACCTIPRSPRLLGKRRSPSATPRASTYSALPC